MIKLDHVAAAVSNLDAAIDFYEHKIGVKFLFKKWTKLTAKPSPISRWRGRDLNCSSYCACQAQDIRSRIEGIHFVRYFSALNEYRSAWRMKNRSRIFFPIRESRSCGLSDQVGVTATESRSIGSLYFREYSGKA